MTIDPSKERLIHISHARQEIDASLRTWQLEKYIRKGIRCRSGVTVLLERAYVPSGLATTREAYHRFLDRINQEQGPALRGRHAKPLPSANGNGQIEPATTKKRSKKP